MAHKSECEQRRIDVISAALHEHTRELTAFVRARVPRNEVDDILQTAAMRAVERAESLKEPSRVLPWLYRLHRNVIVDAMRRRASRGRLLDRAAPVPDLPTQKSEDTCACSVSQVQQMSVGYASILTLVDIGDLTLAEAARVLGITVNNATVRLHRARKALKSRMLEHCKVTSLGDCAECRCVYDGCCVL